MRTPPIDIADGVRAGGDAPLVLIAGPDTIESESHALVMARALGEIARERGLPLVFKASFDKANRTSLDSPRGPGLEAGLAILARVREATGLPVTTDFHVPSQASVVGETVDLLQVPAFLSRQTDVLLAAGRTGRAVNVKKGQFLAPHDVGPLIEKVRSTGNRNVMLTERGSSFGYNNLVVDFRGLRRMRELGVPVCFDATHSVQLPGGLGGRWGEREFAADLARAAVAVGVDALFFEVHDDPANAICDGPNQWPLEEFPALLDALLALDAAAGIRAVSRTARLAGLLALAALAMPACHVPGEQARPIGPGDVALAMLGCAGPRPAETELERLVDPTLLERHRPELLDALATIDPAGTASLLDVVALDGLGRAAVELELTLPGGGLARYDLDLARRGDDEWRVRWLRGPGTEWPPPRRRAGEGLTTSSPPGSDAERRRSPGSL